MEVGTTAATTAAADKYRASLRLNAETVAISRDVASALVMQSEQLDQTETALDVTQQVVGQANYVVRGMSWSGWLANKFSREPTVVLPHASAPSKEIAMGFICPECRVAQVSQRALMEHYESAHASPPATAFLPSNGSGEDQGDVYASDNGLTKEQAAYLAALGPQLLELKHASKGISNHLDMQLAQLDRIEAKSEKTKDDMRLVTAKATKLTSSLLTISPQFRCAFQELTTRKFVANVNGDPVVCKDAASADCLFRAFTLADSTDMWGFRSESSGLFLGINALGAMRIQGAGLKSYEQFAIDVSRPETTLFSFASCFGLGGWVSMRPDGSLFCIRRTSTNKDMAALFKLVRVEG
ncbi:hypothetical protein SPRG_14942 [Saprolegnia parasitica CBS 223.65]|uniref:t-SNARE coiled-coil homology domain-containing protein n=1 Tax=Saprolegnia parasitica (strain CBS 223.65) TaxID=695850 RepID=A0A067BZ48_SAPPC|nr:hypothetical protein SPRG_14942 [Saprolegnia parasitica CBS 223.65]KDO19842.1 hypothetical protein SPRG_14942 [Saprolegnia parasitica CBS 223.65]|eukprot:XP_012209454.1 hypothetical protein SPRG_14942 [Saprolegnia parasitica CBS 223.65]